MMSFCSSNWSSCWSCTITYCSTSEKLLGSCWFAGGVVVIHGSQDGGVK